MNTERTEILSPLQVSQKLQRIAHEILEKNHDEDNFILVGIDKRGYLLAEKILEILKPISEQDIPLLKLTLDKDQPLNSNISLDGAPGVMANKSIILIDDVLNSGRTLIHAAKYLLDIDIKYLTTVVLVDRRHRKFPIKANFVGLTLSTTLQEHITVEFKEDGITAFLD